MPRKTEIGLLEDIKLEIQHLNTNLVSPNSGSTSGSLSVGTEGESVVAAVVGEIAPVDVRNSPATVVVPPNPQALNKFGVSDSRANASIQNITIDFIAAGVKLHGSLQNYTINVNADYVEFLYVNDAIGWIKI